jgi:hypothetical protein
LHVLAETRQVCQLRVAERASHGVAFAHFDHRRSRAVRRIENNACALWHLDAVPDGQRGRVHVEGVGLRAVGDHAFADAHGGADDDFVQVPAGRIGGEEHA